MNASHNTVKEINDVIIGEKIYTKLNDGLITSEVKEIAGDDENE